MTSPRNLKYWTMSGSSRPSDSMMFCRVASLAFGPSVEDTTSPGITRRTKKTTEMRISTIGSVKAIRVRM